MRINFYSRFHFGDFFFDNFVFYTVLIFLSLIINSIINFCTIPKFSLHFSCNFNIIVFIKKIICIARYNEVDNIDSSMIEQFNIIVGDQKHEQVMYSKQIIKTCLHNYWCFFLQERKQFHSLKFLHVYMLSLVLKLIYIFVRCER